MQEYIVRKVVSAKQRLKLTKRHIAYGVLIGVVLFASSASLFHLSPYKSNDVTSQYFRATVLQTTAEKSSSYGTTLDVTARLQDGPNRDKTVAVQWITNFGDTAYKRLPIGSQVLLSKEVSSNQYGIVSRWYMPGIATLFIVLLTLVILIGAWRGITSVLGLAISVSILAVYVVPRIASGHGALATCIEAAAAITLVSIYIAHGISKRTTVAFAASIISLLIVIGLTAIASYVTGTSEVLSEDSVGILYASHPIDLSGLLTGGIIIASLGTLFDITTGQAATVDEIYKVNKKQSTSQLFKKGMSVGREHIAALINTLALVYAGVSLPAIITASVYSQSSAYAHMPLIVRFNTETIAEEVMRTCVASIGMLFALPITTWLAAYILPRWTPMVNKKIQNWFRAH